MIGRRDFIRNTIAGTGALLFTRMSPFAGATDSSTDSRIEILLPELYDGIWVGENSKAPNVNGIRQALVDEMRKIKASVVRFPGGCFADSYDWRDGIGPRFTALL